MKKLFLLLLFTLSLFSATEIKRNILVIFPTDGGNNSATTYVHTRLEAVLNYYGYFCTYKKVDSQYPKDISQYAGIITWFEGDKIKNEKALVDLYLKFKKKGKKLLLIGDLPGYKKYKDIYKKFFGIEIGDTYEENPIGIKQLARGPFGFEKKFSPLYTGPFVEIKTITGDPLLLETIPDYENIGKKIVSTPVFIDSWGMYALGEKIFYVSNKEGGSRWIIDPFKMISYVFNTNYPIPDLSTKNGKRIAYIHIDGDGFLSHSFLNGRLTGDIAYDFLNKYKLPVGVSFIVAELDSNGPIHKGKDTTKINEYAKRLSRLPFVEPASHTYTHPFEWATGKVAYSPNPHAKRVFYGDEKIKAFQEPDHEVNNKYEIEKSVKYVQKLAGKKHMSDIPLYWSGDCMPTYKNLKYIKRRKINAFNGGDTRFDMQYDSIAYVYPAARYVDGLIQIYSSGSNENTYTKLWTDDFWAFQGVLETFKKTGYPKRIKPIDLYFHFYSFEKRASYYSLKRMFDWLYKNRNKLSFIYPSEYINIVKNFYTLKIYKAGKNRFCIKNIKDLREFRFEGKYSIYGKNIKKVTYDKKLNVTYITIKNKVDHACLAVKN